MAKRKYYRTLDKIRTPVEILNVLTGGGLSLGKIFEFWGRNRSGKSTAALQTAQYFLEDYPEGRIVIIDSEANYSDGSRLEKVFNLHPHNGELEVVKEDPRVWLFYIATIEEAIATAIKFSKESKDQEIPTLILIDSLSALVPSRDAEELHKSIEKGKMANQYAGGMALTPRILASSMSHLLGAVASSFASVIVISQVTVDMSNSYMVTEKAKGGIAKEHSLHLSVKFEIQGSSLKAASNEEVGKTASSFSGDGVRDETIKPYTLSTINITKNKMGLTDVGGSVIYIDNASGGRIQPSYELVESLGKNKGILEYKNCGNKGKHATLASTYAERHASSMLPYIDASTGEAGKRLITDLWKPSEIIRSKDYLNILKEEVKNYYYNNVEAVKNIYDQMTEFKEAKGI